MYFEGIHNILFKIHFKAQDLLPADSDGTSDPYFKINYCGVELKSEVIEDTLNPVIFQLICHLFTLARYGTKLIKCKFQLLNLKNLHP